MNSTTLQAHAAPLAQARLRAAEAAEAVMTTSIVRNMLQSRIDTMTAERASIATARRAGVDDSAHGPRLALLAVDLEALSELLAEASATVAKATADAQAANLAVQLAEQAAARTADEILLARLLEHADKIAPALDTTIRQISDVAKRLGLQRPSWFPAPELAQEIHRLDLNRMYR